MKSEKKKLIIGSILAFVGIIFISIFVARFVSKSIARIAEKAKESREQLEYTYNTIVDELKQNNVVPNTWRYVANTSTSEYQEGSFASKYYFFIDNEKYDSYKHYWLEGVEKTEYRNGYNKDLKEEGQYVLHAIRIYDLTYDTDKDYYNVHLSKDKVYYFVDIYDKAIYYKCIHQNEYENDYTIFTECNYQSDSLSSEYIFYQENGEWRSEKLIRE